MVIYIYMYMYRGSSYIKWPFILKCCCLLCSLSPTASHVGVLLQSVSGCLSYPSKNFNDLLEFREVPFVPGPSGWSWALPAPAFLGRKEGKPDGNEEGKGPSLE